MTPRLRLAAAGVILALGWMMTVWAGTPGASAQDAVAPADPAPLVGPEDDTSSAVVNLSAGYVLDPYLLPVIGHTKTPAADLKAGCTGFVGPQPGVTLNWTGATDQLSIFVYTDDDAVLVIEKPDGTVVCNDDAGLNTIAPLIQIANPADGAYKIYVGAAQQKTPALGFLGVTQTKLDDAQLATLDLTPLLHKRAKPQVAPHLGFDLGKLWIDRQGVFGRADFQAGFAPVTTFAAGGGDTAAFQIVDKKLLCAGFLSPLPSYSFTWTGKSEPLRLFFASAKDSALALVTPEKQVICNMDSAADNLNPAIDLPAPTAGDYKVYIASMKPDDVVWGQLTITNDTTATPTPLAPAQ